jgi:uncharacterized protein (TIGR00369 family)
MAETTSQQRQRTFTWSDPSIGAQVAWTMSGLDYLKAMERGDLPFPPMLALMNIHLEGAEEGSAVFSVEPAEYHYNPLGSVHGGLAATLCDSAMGCAVHSTLPAGSGYTTLEIKVNLVRPLTIATGPVTCKGKIIHVGKRTATAEARVTDRDGKLYAHATTTCLILRS